MSVKNLKAFYEKVYVDKDVQARLKNISSRTKAYESDVSELVKLAKTEGFEFTAEELESARAKGRKFFTDAEWKAISNKSIWDCGATWFCGGGDNNGMNGCCPGTWG